MFREGMFLYAFVGLMAFNILASFVYLIGLNQVRASVRRVYRNYTSKP